MGMFDTVICEYEIPEYQSDNKIFQTKDFDCLLDIYKISKDGKLVLMYYKKWDLLDLDEDNLPENGNIKEIEISDFDGDFNFYTLDENNNLIKFLAIFKDGKLKEIQRIYE